MADFAFSFPLVLAQDDQAAPVAPGAAPAVPVTGGGTAAGPGTGTGGTVAPGGNTPAKRPGLFDQQFFLLVMLLVLGMIVFSIMGQRRDRKKREALISAVKKHDRVQTIGGVIGSVVEVKPDYVVLKVDESSNTRITFSRAAIAQVLTASPEPEGGKPEQPAN
jgi:preprotein translocase subunit YajC